METKNRSGFYEENRRGRRRYRPFYPADLSQLEEPIRLDIDMMKLVSDASFALGMLDGASVFGNHSQGIMHLLCVREAVASLQLEGMDTNIEQYLVSELHQRKTHEEKILFGLLEALYNGKDHALTENGLLDLIESFGCKRELRNEQTFTRYKDRDPYAPCKVESMDQALQEYDNYVTSYGEFDELIKAALLQYEVFAIQPLAQLNGIAQRYVSAAYLMQVSRLSKPNLGLSNYYLEHRDEYDNSLCLVSEKGDYEQWIKFFLNGLKESAEKVSELIQEYDALLQKHMTLVAESEYSDTIQAKLVKLLAYLQDHPLVEVKTTAKDLKLSFNTAANLIQILCELGLLYRKDDRNRNRYFLYTDMMELVENN